MCKSEEPQPSNSPLELPDEFRTVHPSILPIDEPDGSRKVPSLSTRPMEEPEEFLIVPSLSTRPMDDPALHPYHWKSGRRTYRKLRALGAPHRTAAEVAAHARRYWATAAGGIQTVLTNRYFDILGLPRLAR